MRRVFVPPFAIFIILTFGISVFAQSKSREELQRELEAKRAELVALERQILAPSETDRASFAEFLRQPNTGLIRLMPRELYDSEAYKDNKKTITMRGGGAYYSFSRHKHEYGYGSDIELDHGFLSVGFAGADYGMLVKAGDVPIEEITFERPVLRFLSEYVVPNAETGARSEGRKFSEGTLVDGINYKRRLAVEMNTTYLLRSINYGESDVLVALRVVRKDTDGSVIIVWKLLKKYSAPELVQNNP
jgi:hypothetical protein